MKKRILSLALGLLLSISVLFVACNDQTQSNANATFVPPPVDANAVVGIPDVPDGLGWNELNANNVYKVSVCGVVKVTDGLADVWLTNPSTNTVWLKVRILDEKDNVLGESGLIRPGEYVQAVQLQKKAAKGAKIAMRIMSYQPETYYSMGEITLNTTIS